jgi:hypothetical protein
LRQIQVLTVARATPIVESGYNRGHRVGRVDKVGIGSVGSGRVSIGPPCEGIETCQRSAQTTVPCYSARGPVCP